jgi:hypothetical protein
MAGDWIKVEENMPDKPEVCMMAARLALDADAVAGKLIRVWAWASRNCHADGVTDVTVRPLLDRVAGTPGFADAMLAAGWLHESNGVLTFPNFEHHCSKTAKERALAERRQQRRRTENNAPVTVLSRSERDKNVTREEKRRENTLSQPTARRERNPLFDTIADVTGQNPSVCGGEIGKAIAAIKAVSGDVTPEEIRRRAANYRAHFSDAALSASALAKWWSKCATASGTQAELPRVNLA